MRAFRIVDWGRAELVDVPVPVPRDDQVLLRVAGAGVCGSDAHMLRMTAGQAPFTPPMTLGHEIAGWVETTGSAVTGWTHGDPVVVYGDGGCGRCRACLASFETCCLQYPGPLAAPGPGIGLDGGMAEFVLVRSKQLVALGGLDPKTAAPLADAGMTAFNAVRRSIAKLAPGTTAVVIGAGGVGLMVTQVLLATTAARVVVVDRDAGSLQLAQDMGAATVLAGDASGHDGGDVRAEVTDAGGGRATAVIDCVGAQATVDLAVALVENRGDLTLVGIAGGVAGVGFGTTAWDVSVSVPFGGSKRDLLDVVALAQRGQAGLPTEIHPLAEAQQTIDRLARGEVRGRAVLDPTT
jgi:propanol-preferring alcohol dehydrogenase